MPETASKAEILRALGRLVRGLSALFWGLPLTLVVYVQTARMDWLDSLGTFAIFPAMLTTGLLVYGLVLMGDFQKQERVWRAALDRAVVVGWVNLGLSPFLYWWQKLPTVPLYALSVAVLGLSSLLFLFNLNQVLHRLTAMLPDEPLRSETRVFTSFNRFILIVIPAALAVYFALAQLASIPPVIARLLALIEAYGLWVALFLTLMPMAMTMALIWKIKEVIFASVFDSGH